MEYFNEHRKLSVAGLFAISFLFGLLLIPMSIEPFLSGTTAHVVGGVVVFFAFNQYIVALYSVPLVRKRKGQDVSFRMALTFALAAPTLGMVTIIPLGIYWPFWACAAIGLIGSIGPLSVLNMVGEGSQDDSESP